MSRKPYTLKEPCANCPFRSDVKFHLAPGRAQEIADASYEQSNFHCHKTVAYDGEDGEGRVASKTRVCAGFLVTMEKEGRANQPTRIAERIGLYDRGMLNMDSPTYSSMAEWVRSYLPETEDAGDGVELEHCGVVASGCTDPAGFSRNGVVDDNPAPPTCSAECYICQAPVCAGCTDHVEALRVNGAAIEVPVCVNCA